MDTTDTELRHLRVHQTKRVISSRSPQRTSVCLKTSQELYLTQNSQLRKRETYTFIYFAFLFQVMLGCEGLIAIPRDLSFCVMVQSNVPNPQHVQALLLPRKKLTQDYLIAPLISKSPLGFFSIIIFSWNSSVWTLVLHSQLQINFNQQ